MSSWSTLFVKIYWINRISFIWSKIVLCIMANLPLLDFAQFTNGSEVEQQRLGKALVNSFRNHGFVRLVNHGFPEKTVQGLLQFVRTTLPLLRRLGLRPDTF